MIRTTLAVLLLLTCSAAAMDNGQYENSDPAIRKWFKNQMSRQGILCCDIADGHYTNWRGTTEGGYEVPIDGTWIAVPEQAVIYNSHNPTGEAVVWYTKFPDHGLVIRCFVPGTES